MGDTVTEHLEATSREWKGKYFTKVDAYNVEILSRGTQGGAHQLYSPPPAHTAQVGTAQVGAPQTQSVPQGYATTGAQGYAQTDPASGDDLPF